VPEAAPSRRLAPGLGVIALVVAVVAAVGPGLDLRGRVACVLAAALLLAGAAASRVLTPTLRAEADVLLVRDGLRLRRLPRAGIRDVRVDRHRRSRGLEIELGDDLVVVPAILLGDSDLGTLVSDLHRWLGSD
jgi:hypothetical protein